MSDKVLRAKAGCFEYLEVHGSEIKRSAKESPDLLFAGP